MPSTRTVRFPVKKVEQGVTIDFELMLCELVQIWSVGRTNQIDPEHIRVLVNRYFPVAMAIGGQDQMTGLFETARKYVAEEIQP